MGTVTKLHYSIAEYWKDKCITKDGNVFTYDEIKANGAEEYEFVICDLGEPKCWACGKPTYAWEEKCYPQWLENGDYRSIWNSKKVRSHLNRCHIIPESLGGNADLSNVFLMCPKCHEASPDTRNKGTFFRWVYRKRKRSCGGMPNADVIFNAVDEELKGRGLPGFRGILEEIEASGACHEFENAINEGGIRKEFEEGLAFHGGYSAESSLYGVLADWLEKEYNDLVVTK